MVMIKPHFFCAKLEDEPEALITVVQAEWTGDWPAIGTRIDMMIGRKMEKNSRNGKWKFPIGLGARPI